MVARTFRPSKRRSPFEKRPAKDFEAFYRTARERTQDYRARSLALHGWICARCAREFDEKNLHLLTVHHKDGNHNNNPSDGRNWENLCVDCHEAEHQRNLLGDFLTRR